MGKLDQAKLLLQMRKVQKELKKEILEVESGDGAVVIEISGEQKVKKVYLDPDRINLDEIETLEKWLAQAMREAISRSQKLAAEKMRPFMGGLGGLGA